MYDSVKDKRDSNTPTVSVVMGVYNNSTTLAKAVESIVSQTYTDWELIICDDASTDDSYQQACRLAQLDKRITVLRNDHNAGCNMVLNRCLEEACGEYIAIMDSDDIALPTRLEKEVDILRNNPQYTIVGAALIHFNEKGDFMTLRYKERPRPTDFTYGITHAHPCCMIRRKALMEIGLYQSHRFMHRVEDYYLLARLYACGYRGYNLQEPLLRYRDDANSFARRTWRNRRNEVYTYYQAFRALRLPIWHYIKLLRPILVGMLPRPIYSYLHRRPWL